MSNKPTKVVDRNATVMGRVIRCIDLGGCHTALLLSLAKLHGQRSVGLMTGEVLALPVYPHADPDERAAVEAIRNAGQAVVRMIEALRVEGYTSVVEADLTQLRFTRNIQGIITLERVLPPSDKEEQQ